jgi:hypothetical protein
MMLRLLLADRVVVLEEHADFRRDFGDAFIGAAHRPRRLGSRVGIKSPPHAKLGSGPPEQPSFPQWGGP